MTHAGHAWRAKWWTQNERPGTTGEWGVWVDEGTCSGGPTTPPTTAHDPPTPPTTPPTTNPPATGQKTVGYFTEWGVYDRNYDVKNIETSGSASRLTHIVYAFGNVRTARARSVTPMPPTTSSTPRRRASTAWPTPGTAAPCAATSTSSRS